MVMRGIVAGGVAEASLGCHVLRLWLLRPAAVTPALLGDSLTDCHVQHAVKLMTDACEMHENVRCPWLEESWRELLAAQHAFCREYAGTFIRTRSVSSGIASVLSLTRCTEYVS